MIKNWTVITQPVKWQSKGLFLRERYLTSTSHPNHNNTKNIIPIFGNKESIKRLSIFGERFNLNKNVNQCRGRRLDSYAMEFCLTLPKGFSPSKDQWEKIIFDISLSVKKYSNLSDDEFKYFKSCIFAVIHQQDQNIKTGSGDHLHLIIPKVIFNKKSFRLITEIQKKQFTKLIKNIYTLSVLNNCNYSTSNYYPKKEKYGNKVEIWKANQESLYNENRKNKKYLVTLNQIKKWLSAYDENNHIQMNRQFNRIKKSYAELLGLNNNKLLNDIDNSISKIEYLSHMKIR
ncbi:hypothetical protein [Photobacterium iliopiscarium]|uniref:hypothetical protein n=1 Tax=Photobacterium iliopiscarium TaxID=56192 RepID=UPI00242D4B29|nr:hypothetical protein [Photobacterium iliopiscarium]